MARAGDTHRWPFPRTQGHKQYDTNPGVTEIVEIPGQGLSPTVDHGWREVAETH